jgi:metal-sulfur cluster biosynthetic enzyme
MAVTQDDVFTALKDCYDPEIPVNIVDLGLIYEIRVTPPQPAGMQDVEVIMTMTSPGCPSHVMIGDQVKDRVHKMPGVRDVKVEVVWMPPWTPERLSAAAKKQLGIE